VARPAITSAVAAAPTAPIARSRRVGRRSGARVRPDPQAHAVIAAYQPGSATGRSAALIVAGDSQAAACAAATTLARHPAAVHNAYAVALDAAGRVVAYGGRP